MFLIHLSFNHQNIALQGLVRSKKPFRSHLKALSWKQEALFCQELTDVEVLGLLVRAEPGDWGFQIWPSRLYGPFGGSGLCVCVLSRE